MENIKKMILWVAIVMLPLNLFADEITTLKLADGSTVKGKIVVQRPGKDITIAAETASFVVEAANLKSLRSKKVKYEELSREWKRWALEKKKLQGDANGRYLIFNEITTKKYVFSDVVKMTHPKSPKETYEQVVPTTYNIKWSDIATIERSISNVPSKMAIDDEVTTRKVAHTTGQKLYDIMNYTNILVLKNESTKEGVIMAQHYGKKAKEKYVTLLHKNGSKENIQTDEIIEFRTTYKQQVSEVYKQDLVYVNEFHISKAKTREEADNTYYVDKKVFPFPEGIVITFKSVGAKFQESWNLIALENMKMSNGSYTQGYTSKMKESNSIKPSTTDLTNNVSSISFTYLSPGFYALVNPNRKETYIIKIVK